MQMDKLLVGRRFARHYGEYHKQAVVQRCIALQLMEALAAAQPAFAPARALEIGMGTGFLSSQLAEAYPEADWFFNDLVDEAARWLPEGLRSVRFLSGDAEELALPSGLDLVASSSVMQWFEDLPAFFARLHEAMSSDGLLALSTFAPSHMQELRELTGVGLDYPSLEQLLQMLRDAGFEPHFTETWEQKLYFGSGREVLEHLRNTGVNSAKSQLWTPRRLADFQREYLRCFNDAAAGETPKLALSYSPIILLAVRT